jgi:3-hydroxyisobutyrate dehydrogenase-like beta-hydroxyacid dehydrogenase
MKIGYIGASGLMGHGMAKNLVAKGQQVSITVHTQRDRVQDLLDAGATLAPSIADLAAQCDVVMICVTGTPQVEAVVTGPHGLLAHAKSGLVIVDCSTSEPASTTHLRELAQAQGVTFVDAPLARSAVEAEAGRLNIMVGATPDMFAMLEPILKCCAENVFHVGGPGAGHGIKLLNNFIGQAICAATAEAFAVGKLAGVDPKQLVALVGAGPVNSGLFQAMAKTLDGDLTGLMFQLDNARKDIRYYTHLAEGMGVPTLMGEAVHQSLSMASALGFGQKFVPSLVEAQERITGAQLVPKTSHTS